MVPSAVAARMYGVLWEICSGGLEKWMLLPEGWPYMSVTMPKDSTIMMTFSEEPSGLRYGVDAVPSTAWVTISERSPVLRLMCMYV
eukprot:1181757-Prorocentrum_minimum.AAC.1